MVVPPSGCGTPGSQFPQRFPLTTRSVPRYLQLRPQPLVLGVQLGLSATHGQQLLVLADPEDLILLLEPLELGSRVLQLWH